jgi:hypothetical protein
MGMMMSIIKFPPLIELPALNHPDAWEEPIFFEDNNVPEIPAQLLPSPFCDFAKNLADAAETSESLAVMVILGVISTATSKYVRVSPKPGWHEPLNIYTLIALPPANNKSLILRACTQPLVEWEREQAAMMAGEIKRQRSERKTQEKIIESLRLRAAKEKDIPLQRALIQEIINLEAALTEPPALPQLFANDATPESLAALAYEQGGAFALFSDEGGILEILAGLYSNGLSNVDILLKGIDGGDMRIRRKDRSLDFNPYLTLVLTVQPAIIHNLAMRKAYSGNGTLERFLYVLPKSNLGFRTHDKPPVNETLSHAYSQKVKTLLSLQKHLKEKDGYHTLKLSAAAYEAWLGFQKKIEYQLRPHERLSSCLGWGGKICGFTLRIAGLLHLADDAYQTPTIEEKSMFQAITLANSLADHALKAYGLMGTDEAQNDAKVLFDWIFANGKLQFKRYDLAFALRGRGIGKSDRLSKALKVLIDRNLISPPQKLPTRKPTTVHFVNPTIFRQFENTQASI